MAMKDRTITMLLAGMILLFFLIYFPVMRYAFHSDGSISQLLLDLRKEAVDEDWQEAKELKGRLVDRWKRDSYLLILNYGEQDFSNMEMAISQIKGGIESEDQDLVVAQTRVAIDLLENMHRIVPRP